MIQVVDGVRIGVNATSLAPVERTAVCPAGSCHHVRGAHARGTFQISLVSSDLNSVWNIRHSEAIVPRLRQEVSI